MSRELDKHCRSCGAPCSVRLTECEYCGTEYHFLPRYYGKLVAYESIEMVMRSSNGLGRIA